MSMVSHVEGRAAYGGFPGQGDIHEGLTEPNNANLLHSAQGMTAAAA